MKWYTVAIPPVWSIAAGYILTPLLTALDTPRPDVVAGAVQLVTFTALGTGVFWLWSREIEAGRVNDLTVRDWQQKRAEYQAQEREVAREYAAVVSERGAYKIVIGSRSYHFPPGIYPEHLLALAKVVGEHQPPTDRALVPPFTRGDGETYQVFRDWMIYHAGQPGEFAQYRTKRGDWELSLAGKRVLLQWLTSLSPTRYGGALKKARSTLSKANREQSSNGTH